MAFFSSFWRVALYAVTVFSFAVPGHDVIARQVASSRKPLDLDAVADLLKNRTNEAEIKKQIVQFKADFDLTPESTAKLVRAGASDELLAAIKTNRYHEASVQQEASSRRSLTADQIIDLLKNKVKETEIKNQIAKFKVDFDLTPESTAKLVRAGAGDELLEAIKTNRSGELVITYPRNGEECGATTRIEGRSMIISDKFLWVFAHRKGLSAWWPQSGVVSVEKNGMWVQGINLGGLQDVGFDFEIKAMWVDATVDRRMKDYLANGEKTGQYPGIPLPEGAPIAEVTVRKVRH
jgi:hypothetical protein